MHDGPGTLQLFSKSSFDPRQLRWKSWIGFSDGRGDRAVVCEENFPNLVRMLSQLVNSARYREMYLDKRVCLSIQLQNSDDLASIFKKLNICIHSRSKGAKIGFLNFLAILLDV